LGKNSAFGVAPVTSSWRRSDRDIEDRFVNLTKLYLDGRGAWMGFARTSGAGGGWRLKAIIDAYRHASRIFARAN